jgi:hypothetical protein
VIESCAAGDGDSEGTAGNEANALVDRDVAGIFHGDHQNVPFESNGNDPVGPDDIPRKLLPQVRGNVVQQLFDAVIRDSPVLIGPPA